MAARRKLKLRGKVYPVPSFDEVPIKDALLFDVQAEDLGIPERWTDVEEAALVAAQLDPEKDMAGALHFSRSRQGRVVVAATVWLAMRFAGEDVTLSEATEIPESEVGYVEAPKDRRPKKAPARKKAATRTSGRAAGNPAR